MIAVERYPRAGRRYSISRPALDLGPVNTSDAVITPNVISASWSDGIEPPFQTLQLRVSGAVGLAPFDIGDHIVVRRAPNIPACMWAIVISLGTARRRLDNGKPEEAEWDVRAVGWFDFLGRMDVVSMGTASETGTVGTVFGFNESPFAPITNQWQQALDATLSELGRAYQPAQTASDDLVGLFGAQLDVSFGAGTSLAKFMRLAPRVLLPPSMQGGSATLLREAVRVVHDGDTAVQFCGDGVADREGMPARQCEPIIGQNPSVQPLLNGSANMLSLIQGTWAVDPGLGEMFPSLEDPGNGETAVLSPAQQAQQKLDAALLTVPNLVTGEPAPIDPELANSPDYQTTISADPLLPGPAKVLGRNPVLLYRMKPWRAVPLDAWLKTLGTAPGGDDGLPPLSLRGLLGTALSALPAYPTMNAVTWDLSRAVRLTLDDVTSMEFGYEDSDAWTVITSQFAGSETVDSFNTRIGLPIFDQLAAVLGAKVYTVAWPFLRATDAQGNAVKASATQQVAILAAQAAQWHMASDRFARGTLTLRPRGDIRAGEPFILEFPTCALIGYVDRVTSNVQLQEDRRSESTSVVFSRGLWNEDARNYPPYTVDVPAPWPPRPIL